jgi:hypothetical protein
LCSDDYGVGEGFGGFQSVRKVNINDSSEEGVGEKGDICIISRVGGVVRAAREGVRSSKLGSWDMVEFQIEFVQG